MKHITTVARVLLGLIFVVFSLNFFFHFLPAQPPPPASAMALLGGLVSSKMLAVVKTIELVAGVALLANRFVPLALTLLAPIVVAIAIVHVTVLPSGVAMAVALVAIEAFLAWSYRSAFAPMLRAKVAADPLTGPAEELGVHAPSPA